MSYVDLPGNLAGANVIGDHNYHQFINPLVGGERKGHGLVPRNLETHPQYCYSWAPQGVDVPMIPEAEWPAWIAKKDAEKSWLNDIRMKSGPNGGMIPSRDQNGRGYCWRHSACSAVLLYRAKMGQPYADLSAYAGACRLRNYRDEGGWGAEGVDDEMKYGDPTSEFWPQRAVDRKYDTPETWANAKQHVALAQWADLTRAQYDRKLSWAQVVSCHLQNMPTVDDFNWWSHSVCGCGVVNGKAMRACTRAQSGKLLQLADFDRAWAMDNPVTGGLGNAIWNSWGDREGANGIDILTGNKATPDGCVALCGVRPAA